MCLALALEGTVSSQRGFCARDWTCAGALPQVAACPARDNHPAGCQAELPGWLLGKIKVQLMPSWIGSASWLGQFDQEGTMEEAESPASSQEEVGKRRVQSTHLGQRTRSPWAGHCFISAGKLCGVPWRILIVLCFLCLELDKTFESSDLHLNAGGKR